MFFYNYFASYKLPLTPITIKQQEFVSDVVLDSCHPNLLVKLYQGRPEAKQIKILEP